MPRWMDIGIATLGLTFALPLLLVIALLIELDTRGPVLFRQVRVGRGGQPFWMVKFRTMTADAGGGALTVGDDDPRVTWVGGFLRRTKFDELPQLWNVLRGDMKLVGPRPEVPEYVRLYDEGQRRVLNVPPGMTDPASIAYCNEARMLGAAGDPHRTYVEEILPRKLAMNVAYLERRNGWTDLGILAETLRKAVLRV